MNPWRRFRVENRNLQFFNNPLAWWQHQINDEKISVTARRRQACSVLFNLASVPTKDIEDPGIWDMEFVLILGSGWILFMSRIYLLVGTLGLKSEQLGISWILVVAVVVVVAGMPPWVGASRCGESTLPCHLQSHQRSVGRRAGMELKWQEWPNYSKKKGVVAETGCISYTIIWFDII